MIMLIRNAHILFLGLLIFAKPACAMVSDETISRIMNRIAKGSYDEALKEHKMFPLLIERSSESEMFAPEKIKSILWLKSDTASNENPYLVYMRTQWKEFRFDVMKSSTSCKYQRAVQCSPFNESFDVVEVCTSKAQKFTSEPDEINKEIACHEDVRSFYKYNPQFKTCLCECITPIINKKQNLQIVTSEDIRSTVLFLIGLYRKKQQRNRRIADSPYNPSYS